MVWSFNVCGGLAVPCHGGVPPRVQHVHAGRGGEVDSDSTRLDGVGLTVQGLGFRVSGLGFMI